MWDVAETEYRAHFFTETIATKLGIIPTILVDITL